MTDDNEHVICPVLSSPGPRAGMIAFYFEGARRALTLRSGKASESGPRHAGQRVLDALFERAGVQSTLRVETDLRPDELQDPRWLIPFAVETLLAVRARISGLAELLYEEDIVRLLADCQIINPAYDQHRVHAAIHRGFSVQLTHQGNPIHFVSPPMAVVWLKIDYPLSQARWTQYQLEHISQKKHRGQSERITKSLLLTLMGDEFAIPRTIEALQPEDSLLNAIPAWLPARNIIKSTLPSTVCALEGNSADMLIFSPTEDEARQAATLIFERLEAHSIHAELYGWTTLDETT